MTENEIRDTLSPLATSLQCSQCRLAFMGRIDDLVAQWAMINVSVASTHPALILIGLIVDDLFVIVISRIF